MERQLFSVDIAPITITGIYVNRTRSVIGDRFEEHAEKGLVTRVQARHFGKMKVLQGVKDEMVEKSKNYLHDSSGFYRFSLLSQPVVHKRLEINGNKTGVTHAELLHGPEATNRESVHGRPLKES